jgi:hypothetical protein
LRKRALTPFPFLFQPFPLTVSRSLPQPLDRLQLGGGFGILRHRPGIIDLGAPILQGVFGALLRFKGGRFIQIMGAQGGIR